MRDSKHKEISTHIVYSSNAVKPPAAITVNTPFSQCNSRNVWNFFVHSFTSRQVSDTQAFYFISMQSCFQRLNLYSSNKWISLFKSAPYLSKVWTHRHILMIVCTFRTIVKVIETMT